MRILKMEELEGDQFTTKLCLSQRMLVDIGTKFVPAIAFWTLNDAICGYTTAPPPTDAGDGDQFDNELREQLTRGVRAQHRKEHTEVQGQLRNSGSVFNHERVDSHSMSGLRSTHRLLYRIEVKLVSLSYFPFLFTCNPPFLRHIFI